MRRKNIIGLSVFSKKTGEILGVVQELKVDRESLDIAFFIITCEIRANRDNSLMLPFNRTILNDDDLESTVEDMMAIDSVMYHNESRKSEDFFYPKSIYDSEGKNMGIVTDFDFNKRTGKLENIYYFDTNTKKFGLVESKYIKSFYDVNLELKNDKELDEKLEEEQNKNETKVS